MRWLSMTALSLLAPMAQAQSILNTNLIVNGNAEAGSAGTPAALVASIPGWTRTGKANVLAYNLTGYLLLSNPAPPDHGFQYFYAGDPGSGASTLTQTIDVSAGASLISAGNIKFTAAAYLGGVEASHDAQVQVAFQNGNGQTFSSVTLGPLTANIVNSLYLQQAIGLVPTGTMKITVTLSFDGALAAADSLSLVLSQAGAGTTLGTNLIANPGAEAGPSAPTTGVALYIPNWSSNENLSVCPYGGSGWIPANSPGPADRGVNLFCKTIPTNGAMYQDIDVSGAATLIDSGQVTYEVSAWIGGLYPNSSPTLVYTFYDWSGNQLAATGTLGPINNPPAALVETSATGMLPHGTRRVNITLNFGAGTLDAVADDINFTLAAPPGPPVIGPGGIVSAGAFGGFSSISPGSWIEIYGFNLAPATQNWAASDFKNGVAPTSLGNVTVSVGGQSAFIDYISPGQVNALVPSNVPTGPVAVTVTSPNGTSDSFWLNVNATEPGMLAPPSFQVNGKQYVAALFSDGQTFAIPQGAIPGVPSRAAKPGDTLTIYGVGFGPVTGGFTAGTIVTAQNAVTAPVQFLFGTTAVTPSYGGLAPSFTGLYQFNLTVPSVAANAALPFSFMQSGVKGSQTLYIAVQN